MAIIEKSGFLKYKDASGNTTLMYPITTKDNVDGMDDIDAHVASQENPHNVTADQIEAISYSAQSLTDEQKAQARTNIGAAEACGVTYLESTDTNNMTALRDLDSGTYILYGKFKPFVDSTATISFSSSLLVNIIKGTSNSQVMVFYPVNNCVQYLKITDTAYERKNIYLNDLATTSALEDILPAVTTDDAGKFLRVSSDGAWAAETLANAEEASF